MRPAGLSLLLGVLLVSPARGQDTVVVGVGGELSAPPFERLRVPIFVDLRNAGGEKLGSYTVRVAWNRSALTYRSWTNGTFAAPTVRTDSTFYGVFRAAAISPSGTGGVVDIFNLELSADVVDVDTIRVGVTELSAAGTLRDLLATAVIVYRPGAFCPAMGRWGDLDADGQANSRDALAILSDLVGLPVDAAFNLALGDVDGDGKTDSRDALILLSYAVGIDIPGQRVLLVAGGACTAGGVPQLVIVPDTADLVLRQAVQFQVFGRDASGRLTALNNVRWSIADGRVGVVDSTGRVTAREPGTTEVTAAIGPGAQLRAVLVSRARRGTWRVDARRAKQATVQMGTQKWPFATPQFAFPFLTEGDTIRVAPGTHDYEPFVCYGECPYAGEEIYAGAVIIGDTLADGTRPVLRSRELDYHYGFRWYGGVRGEIRDLVLRGFYYPVYVYGVKSLVLENVRLEDSRLSYNYGIYAGRFIDSLRVRRSELVGDTARQSYYGIYLETGARYLEIHDSKVTNWGSYAVYGTDVDSLDVLRSEFRNNGSGIRRTWSVTAGGARISRSRFDQNDSYDIYLDGVRQVGLDHNFIHTDQYGNAIWVNASDYYDDAPPAGGKSVTNSTGPRRAPQANGDLKLTMVGDSIKAQANGYYWLYAYDLDSVVIDSLWLESPADTAISQYSYIYTDFAQVTNSKFLNLYNEGFEFRGRKLVVDRSEFRGCAAATCDWTRAYAIQAYQGTDSGPAVTLTNSTFFNIAYPLYSVTSGVFAGPMVITNNTVDSTAEGFRLRSDSIYFADNVMTRVRDYGVYAEPSYSNRPLKKAVFLRNRVTCNVTTSTAYGILTYYSPAVIEDNAVRGCDYGIYPYNTTSYPLADLVIRRDTVFVPDTMSNNYGIWVSGPWRATISANRVQRGYYGMYLGMSDTAAHRVDSNAVSGSSQIAIYIAGVPGPITGVRNNIANNVRDGIYNSGGGARSFTLGKFNSGGMGNGRWAVQSSAAFDATQNWWGLSTGPGGAFGTPGTSADSVSSANVNTGSFLTAEPADVPALAPGPPGARQLGLGPPASWTAARLVPWPGLAKPPALRKDPPRAGGGRASPERTRRNDERRRAGEALRAQARERAEAADRRGAPQ